MQVNRRIFSFSEARILFNCQGSNGDGTGNIQINGTTGLISGFSGGALSYLNGEAGNQTVINVYNEIVITGVSFIQGTGANKSLIGSYFTNTNEFDGSFDLVEIYKD